MEQHLSAMIKDLNAAKRDLKQSGGFFPAKRRGGDSAAFDGTEGGRLVAFSEEAPTTGRSRARASRGRVAPAEVALAARAVRKPRVSRAPASRGGVIPAFTGAEGGVLLGAEVVVKSSRRPRGGVLMSKSVGGDIPAFTGAEGGVLLGSQVDVKSSRGGAITTGGARKPNPWLVHVAKVRAANPGMSYKQCLMEAKKSY